MAKVREKCLGRQTRLSVPRLVSLAAVFWMSRNALPKERRSFGGALRDIQKTAARVTIPERELFQY